MKAKSRADLYNFTRWGCNFLIANYPSGVKWSKYSLLLRQRDKKNSNWIDKLMVLLMTSLESSEEKGFDSFIFALLVPCGRKASAYFGHYKTEIYTLVNVSLRRCSTTSINLWMRWIEGNCILPYWYIIHGLLGLLQKAAEIVPQLRQAQTNWRKCIIAVYIPATGGRTRGETNHPKQNDTYILATKARNERRS
jgi:hypothetical protein